MGAQLVAFVTFFTITVTMHGSLCLGDTLPREHVEKQQDTSPSSPLSLVTVGLGLPGEEDTQTNHHFLKLLKKKTDLNWSSSQIIRMC